MPDGRIARFEVPEGTAPEAAQAAFEEHLASQPAPQRSPGQEIDHIARRTLRMPLQAAAGTVGMVGDALNSGINAIAGTKLGMPSEAIQRGIDRITPRPETFGEKATDFVGTVAAGGLGKGVDPLARAITARLAGPAGATASKHLTPRQQTLIEGRQAGYVVPPSQGEGGKIASTVEYLSGKPNLQFEATIRNQAVTDDLARRAVGLPKDADLSFESLNTAIKQTYAEGYEPIKQLGRMTNGGVYRKALDKALTEFQGASSSFPGAQHDDVRKLVDSYRVREFDAAEGIAAIQNLRENATAAFRSGNNALGKASRAIAHAIEESIELNVKGRGMDGSMLLDGFRHARQMIAKQDVVRNAIKEGSGNVDAHKIAMQLQKGKPLTGELAVIGRFANTAKAVTKLPDAASRPAFPYVPAFAASTLGGLLGGPVGAGVAGGLTAASPIAKSGLRKGIMSAPAQRMLGPKVDPHIVPKLAKKPSVINAMPTALMQSGLFGND